MKVVAARFWVKEEEWGRIRDLLDADDAVVEVDYTEEMEI